MAKIMLEGWKCERCGHEWVPREGMDPPPRVCAKCKSPYWNVPRRTPKPSVEVKTKKKKKNSEPDKE